MQNGDRASWVRSFSVIDEKNDTVKKEVLEEAAAKPADAVSKQLGDFYATCLDEAKVEANAKIGVADSAAQLVGPGLAGALIQWLTAIKPPRAAPSFFYGA